MSVLLALIKDTTQKIGYKLFTLTEVTPSIGGLGSVKYNLADELTNGEVQERLI